MSLCDKRLVKLQERIANPLPAYSREQIQRTRKMQLESSAAGEAGGDPGGALAEAAPSAEQPHSAAGETSITLAPPRGPGRQLHSCYSLARGSQPSPGDGGAALLRKRELPFFPAEFPAAPRDDGSHSEDESPLAPHSTQKNKLTNYFEARGIRPPRPPENFGAAQFAQLVEAPRRGALAAELLLREREREAAGLRASVQELYGYRERAKRLLAEQVLGLENLRREEEKQWLAARRQSLGELVSFREGARFRELWVDGPELARLKEELVRVQGERELAERRRKQVKRRARPGEAAREARPPCAASAAELSDSSSFSLLGERQAEECREALNGQIFYLAREENLLKQRLEAAEQAREEYLARAKRVHEEENSRFGRLTLSDPALKWPLLGGRYQLLGLLGKGGFSEVYRAFDVEELRPVACKIHQLAPSWTEQAKSNYITHILREAKVHRALRHQNIVAHFDNVEIDLNSFCTVLEFCGGPDLASYLRRQKTLAEKEAKLVMRQVFNGLKFLNEHERRVIHYDLKPQNILFHNGVVKISDFGLCKVMARDETQLELTSQGVGTYWYLPPECFQRESARISPKVDVWSAGVVYFELLFGVKPFGQDLSQERIWREGVMLRAHTLEFPSKPVVSLEAREFLRRCLVYDQAERIDVLEACALLGK